MKLSVEGKFRLAVKTAVLAGVTVGAQGAVYAQAGPDAPASTPEAEGSTDLGAMQVTGSRIRRVDTETASPVFSIDRATIESSGVVTVGELIRELPSVAGAASNPQVNNGGGDGATNVSLRGLGSDRTLILLNGRRLVTQDVNAIPLNLIERVDVLKEGASAIYGSDAIGGVVNFITRHDPSGAEISLDYGVSGEDDGGRRGVSLSWGASDEKASILFGLNYNEQKKISAGDRDFSKFAVYLYGSVFNGGSSSTPTGRIFLPANSQQAAAYGCTPAGGNISITRIAGAAGDSPDDFRCYVGATDSYNYQPLNLILTPQERGSVFTTSTYKFNDTVEGYLDLFHNFTSSGFQIAPLPFVSRTDDIVISKDSLYNPFGVDFGGADGVNTNAQFRLEAIGNRRNKIKTDTDQINLGLKGRIADSSWHWDAGIGYGRVGQDTNTQGYLFSDKLANAVGPSFIDASGNPACGTSEADVISGCVPVNIFNLAGDPDSIAALSTITGNYRQDQIKTLKTATANLTGDLFTYAAGTASLAVGIERREERFKATIDAVATALPPDYINCGLQQETCGGNTVGSNKVTEYYAEAFVPLLSEVTGAKALNLILGTRFSDYASFGTTTNSKVSLEWRPVWDLLIRGGYAQVFRAPTISDRFLPPTANAPTFNDPCVGLTSAQLAANPNYALACQNVTPDSDFDPANSQITGVFRGNADLKPEEGDVITYGFVYDPKWLKNFSTTVDFFRYDLDKVIDPLDVNTIGQQCVDNGNFCDLITRFPDGTVQLISQPIANLGRLKTQGVDIGFKYRLNNTPIGSFRFSVDTTYIDTYDRTPDTSSPSIINSAGKYSRQDGNFARVRSLGNITWAIADVEALWNVKYIHGIKLEDPDGAPGVQPTINYGSQTYHDFTLAYTVPVVATKLQVGVNNAFDKQPPILYQNNVTNANTDVQTYDTIGRYFIFRASQSF